MEINEFTNSRFLIDINNYKIDQKMEKYGYGTVYSVIDKENGQSYAAKVINCNYEEKKAQHVVEREIGIMMRLQHPALIRFYGFSLKDFHGENNITILMSLCKNGSLTELLESSRKSDKPNTVLTNTLKQIILIGIARGMMILHKKHVIHRDLKTQNILLDHNMHPRITDYSFSRIFQLSGLLTSQSQSNTAWFYVAPEVISNNKYTYKSDVYSFAIIMFEVLTNCVPYSNLVEGQVSTLQFGQKVVDENYRPKFTVPIKKSFQNLIEKCWSKDPDERPTFQDIFEKLTENFWSSIYTQKEETSDDDDSEENYCLDDVDFDEVRSYIDSITEDELAVLIEELSRKVEIISLNSNQLLKDNKSLKKENRNLRKENEQIKERLQNLENILNEKQNEQQKNMAVGSAQNSNSQTNIEKASKPPIPPQDSAQSGHVFIAASSPNGSSLKKTDGSQSGSSVKTADGSGPLSNEGENKIIRLLLGKGLTVQFFNALPANSQKTIINDIATNTPSDQAVTYFDELNKLLAFLLNFEGTSNCSSFIEITPISHKENAVMTTVLHKAIELLHHNSALQNETFIKQLKSLHDAEIQVRYPSKSFKKIYNKVHKIRRSQISNLKVAIFITGTHHTDTTFAGNKHITAVKFDSCVATITGGSMSGSFSFCTQLSKVIIPSTVTSIGDCAFLGCTALKEIKIPPSVTSIGFRAFEGCSSLTKIKIPSSVTSIGWRAFRECPSLTEISIPLAVKSIGDEAFPVNARIVRRTAKD